MNNQRIIIIVAGLVLATTLAKASRASQLGDLSYDLSGFRLGQYVLGSTTIPYELDIDFTNPTALPIPITSINGVIDYQGDAIARIDSGSFSIPSGIERIALMGRIDLLEVTDSLEGLLRLGRRLTSDLTFIGQIRALGITQSINQNIIAS